MYSVCTVCCETGTLWFCLSEWYMQSQLMWERECLMPALFLCSLCVSERLRQRSPRLARCPLLSPSFPLRHKHIQLIDGSDFENCASAAQHRWLWSIHTADRSARLPAVLSHQASKKHSPLWFQLVFSLERSEPVDTAGWCNGQTHGEPKIQHCQQNNESL